MKGLAKKCKSQERVARTADLWGLLSGEGWETIGAGKQGPDKEEKHYGGACTLS